MNELKNRGVEDILIAVVDGLKGFPDAIQAVFPDTTVQTCIVHLLRQSLQFVSYKDRKAVATALKGIYKAVDAAAGEGHGHSAHVGRDVVVHYRWHPLHGRRLRRHYGEDRRTGRFVHVETGPGVVVVVAAWMLDPAACAGMELGPPRASAAALAGLHDLLTRRGLRRSSPGDPVVQEKQDDPTRSPRSRPAPPRQLQHRARFRAVAEDERGRARERGRDAWRHS